MSSFYEALGALFDTVARTYGMPSGEAVSLYLRRNGVDRACTAFEADFSPREIDGNMVMHADRRFYVSTVGLDTDPDYKLDQVVLDDNGVEKVLVFATPPKRRAPGGVNVFWELHVRSR